MILTGKKKQQNKKIQAYKRGIRREILAGLYLTLTGWRVLAWRWKCPLGEIDLLPKGQGHHFYRSKGAPKRTICIGFDNSASMETDFKCCRYIYVAAKAIR